LPGEAEGDGRVYRLARIVGSRIVLDIRSSRARAAARPATGRTRGWWTGGARPSGRTREGDGRESESDIAERLARRDLPLPAGIRPSFHRRAAFPV